MTVMNRPRTVTAVLAAITLAACGEPTGPADDLARNRARWEAQGYVDYEFVFQRLCYCDDAAVAPVQIRVEDGAVAGVIDTLGQPVDSLEVAWYFTITIDSLFDIVESAIARPAHRLTVQYHEEFGYPERIAIDWIGDAVDDEVTYEAGLLLPFSPAPVP